MTVIVYRKLNHTHHTISLWVCRSCTSKISNRVNECFKTTKVEAFGFYSSQHFWKSNYGLFTHPRGEDKCRRSSANHSGKTEKFQKIQLCTQWPRCLNIFWSMLQVILPHRLALKNKPTTHVTTKKINKLIICLFTFGYLVKFMVATD